VYRGEEKPLGEEKEGELNEGSGACKPGEHPPDHRGVVASVERQQQRRKHQTRKKKSKRREAGKVRPISRTQKNKGELSETFRKKVIGKGQPERG